MEAEDLHRTKRLKYQNLGPRRSYLVHSHPVKSCPPSDIPKGLVGFYTVEVCGRNPPFYVISSQNFPQILGRIWTTSKKQKGPASAKHLFLLVGVRGFDPDSLLPKKKRRVHRQSLL